MTLKIRHQKATELEAILRELLEHRTCVCYLRPERQNGELKLG